ncbi:MAG: hypothetical protein ACFBSD_12895 [Paracoccaceae bacterium]
MTASSSARCPHASLSGKRGVRELEPLIVQVEPTAPIWQAEPGPAQGTIRRTRETFGLYPQLLAVDAVYGAADLLGRLVEDEGSEPHIPVFEMFEGKDGAFLWAWPSKSGVS